MEYDLGCLGRKRGNNYSTAKRYLEGNLKYNCDQKWKKIECTSPEARENRFSETDPNSDLSYTYEHGGTIVRRFRHHASRSIGGCQRSATFLGAFARQAHRRGVYFD